jgi:hypothetical protein
LGNVHTTMAIARFRALSNEFYRVPGRLATAEKRRLYHQAQIELFGLVQAICAQTDPALQLRLDSLRREIVAQLACDLKTQATGAYSVSTLPRRALSWRDFQITPEIAIDSRLAGNAVLRSTVKKLKEALRDQAGVLRRVLAN